MSGRASRAPSAVAAIGGFGIGIALLSVATTAAIVLIAPEPDGLRVTIGEAAAALRADTRGFQRSVGAEPAGRRAFIFESVLADQVRRPVRDVRIVMTGRESFVAPWGPAKGAPGGQPPVLVIHRNGGRLGGGDAPFPVGRTILRSDDVRALQPLLNPPPAVRAGLATVPISPFVAAVRQADGRWLMVTPSQPWLSGWRLRVLAAFLTSLLLIVPLAWLFARRLTRPFRTLARAVDAGGTAIPIDGPRELREAAGAIAAMRARLARETAERLRMLTAVAHDLRTPLTSLRLRIDAADEPQRSRMADDVERMQAMITEVLDFARHGGLERERVAVRPLLRQIVVGMDAGRASVTLLPGDDAHVEVVASAFRRAIENLVRNAIDYAGGGTLAVDRDDNWVTVTMRDGGPGIPVDDIDRLLRPFERGEQSRSRDTGGAGLGLSIVQDFADRHGGHLVLAGASGGGLVAQLWLPNVAADRPSGGQTG